MFEEPFHHHLNQLIAGHHPNPHAILGIHPFFEDQKVIRVWHPGARQIFIELRGMPTEARQIGSTGLFECIVPHQTTRSDYRVFHQDGLCAADPYACSPTFGEIDQYLFGKGVHYQLWQQMGGRLTTHEGVRGAKFSVWAPNAKSVSLVADFNYWDGRVNPLRMLSYSGVWELFVPGLEAGCRYKFEIWSHQGERRVKADPYALLGELRPATASVLCDSHPFKWGDEAWIQKRKKQSLHRFPMLTYEVHLGSWRKHHGTLMNYREAAEALACYCREMGFNYVELLPVQEHPLDESWGYQVSGFYAPTRRYGMPNDFRAFVDHLHRHDIGVILDWVPGHFPTDDFSLGRFDGSCLYEHADPRQGYHPHWHTHIFNFGRHEVSNFLIANALFWLEEMHVDGLRVDAVASMLYLDYGREEGEWIPNAYGGRENLQAIEFLKHLNSVVHQRVPGALMIAEESTSFTGVTHPLEQGGLGFDLKWNMGWMNDTLRYFSKDCFYRHHHLNDLTFGLLYAFSEQFALVFSHDEVVHGKKALLSKMPGDTWQQFANLRLLLSYMMCQPGKKLLFMGGEIGQWNEWNCKGEVEWGLLAFETHRGIQTMVRELNALYHVHPALWEGEMHHETFQWIDFSDTTNSVISYIRRGGGEALLCIHHFTPSYVPHYILHLPSLPVSRMVELFNSDCRTYGGSGKVNGEKATLIHGERGAELHLSMPPLATLIFQLL